MNDQDDKRVSALLEDVSFITAPIHFFIEGIKFWLGVGFGLLLCIVLPLHSCVTSPSTKAKVNKEVEQRHIILRVDFRHPVTEIVPDVTRPNEYSGYAEKMISMPFGFTSERESEAGEEGDKYFNGHPFEFCNPNKRGLLTFVTPTRIPDNWAGKINFSFDSTYWVMGKSAPMYDAYASTAYTVTALRRSLAAIKKHGLPPPTCRDLTPDEQWSETQVEEELTAAEAGIHIDNVPVVRLSFMRGGVKITPGLHEWAGNDLPDFLIAGICLENDCVSDDFKYDNPMSYDLFGPTFTAHQKAAMEALRKVTTDDFWLSVAHANGIHDDDRVRAAAAHNRVTVSGMFPEEVK